VFFRTPTVFPALLFLVSTAFLQQPAASQQNDANDIATNLVNATRAYLSGRSSALEVAGEFREVSRGRNQTQLVVQYHVFIHGAPSGTSFTAMAWPINAQAPSQVIDGITLGKDGVAMCDGRAPDHCGSAGKVDDPIAFTFVATKGEPVRLALVSSDQKITVMFGAVPDPVQKTDRGCTLQAIRLLPKWELVMIQGSGFKPDETVHFFSKSYDEKHEAEVTADNKGQCLSALVTSVKGKSTGRTHVRITSRQCSPDVSFEWGTM
jgi:hypothetical protein